MGDHGWGEGLDVVDDHAREGAFELADDDAVGVVSLDDHFDGIGGRDGVFAFSEPGGEAEPFSVFAIEAEGGDVLHVAADDFDAGGEAEGYELDHVVVAGAVATEFEAA